MKVDRLLLESLDVSEWVVTGGGDEGRIPMPVPASVAVAQVLCQAVEVARASAVRQVFRDRVGGLIQVVEAVHVAGHEVADSVGAHTFETRHHVDEDEFGHYFRPGPVRGNDSGQAAHAGTDQHHRTADLLQDGCGIAGESIDGVFGVRRTVAVAVTAGVECDHVKATVGQYLAGALPGEPILPTTVQHHDRGLATWAVAPIPFVADQCQRRIPAELHGCRTDGHGDLLDVGVRRTLPAAVAGSLWPGARDPVRTSSEEPL